MIDPENDSAVALTIGGLMKVPKLAGFDTRTDRCERCDRWGVGLPGTPLVWFLDEGGGPTEHSECLIQPIDFVCVCVCKRGELGRLWLPGTGRKGRIALRGYA